MIARSPLVLLGAVGVLGLILLSSGSAGASGAPANTPGAVLGTRFHNGDQIDAWFKERMGVGFVGWFLLHCARRDAWSGVTIKGSPADFTFLWRNADFLYGPQGVTLAEVLVLMAIVINETAETIRPISEIVGAGYPGHPGLAYPFDTIPQIPKRSYNMPPWTALACFNDETFIAAHGNKPMGAMLAHTTDPAWAGDTYVQTVYPTTVDPNVTGFVQEADFYKFRGRGYIQTTSRANYAPLIQWIQGYTGSDPVLRAYRASWAGRPIDVVANASSNVDWDKLFQQTGGELPIVAIAIHNHGSGNYLSVSSNPAELLGTGPNSAYHAGLRVSGGAQYARLFQKRVTQMVASLPA